MSLHKSNKSIIALLDSSTSIDEIKKIVRKASRIITFDYTSHKILLKNKIKHEISDNYISKLELDEIQNKSYQFSKWAKSSQICDSLEYKGFNLGNFFYIEIFIYLLPMLKKLLEVNTVSQNFKNYHFFCSANIEPIASLFNESCERLGKKNRTTTEFFNDSIELQNNFFNLKISRTNYFTMHRLPPPHRHRHTHRHTHTHTHTHTHPIPSPNSIPTLGLSVSSGLMDNISVRVIAADTVTCVKPTSNIIFLQLFSSECLPCELLEEANTGIISMENLLRLPASLRIY